MQHAQHKHDRGLCHCCICFNPCWQQFGCWGRTVTLPQTHGLTHAQGMDESIFREKAWHTAKHTCHTAREWHMFHSATSPR